MGYLSRRTKGSLSTQQRLLEPMDQIAEGEDEETSEANGPCGEDSMKWQERLDQNKYAKPVCSKLAEMEVSSDSSSIAPELDPLASSHACQAMHCRLMFARVARKCTDAKRNLRCS